MPRLLATCGVSKRDHAEDAKVGDDVIFRSGQYTLQRARVVQVDGCSLWLESIAGGVLRNACVLVTESKQTALGVLEKTGVRSFAKGSVVAQWIGAEKDWLLRAGIISVRRGMYDVRPTNLQAVLSSRPASIARAHLTRKQQAAALCWLWNRRGDPWPHHTRTTREIADYLGVPKEAVAAWDVDADVIPTECEIMDGAYRDRIIKALNIAKALKMKEAQRPADTLSASGPRPEPVEEAPEGGRRETGERVVQIKQTLQAAFGFPFRLGPSRQDLAVSIIRIYRAQYRNAPDPTKLALEHLELEAAELPPEDMKGVVKRLTGQAGRPVWDERVLAVAEAEVARLDGTLPWETIEEWKARKKGSPLRPIVGLGADRHDGVGTVGERFR